MNKTTIYEFMDDLQDWHTFSPRVIQAAKISKINTSNNSELRRLVNGWIDGRYDEDIKTLCNEVEHLL